MDVLDEDVIIKERPTADFELIPKNILNEILFKIDEYICVMMRGYHYRRLQSNCHRTKRKFREGG